MIVTPEDNTNPSILSDTDVVIFLAGSIDNGRAVNWQPRMASMLDTKFNQCKLPEPTKNRLVIANPRRKYWDPRAGEDEVEKQILWEQDWLDAASIVFFNFSAGSQAPISFLELGLMLGKGGKYVLVNCPETFYRYTNVRVMSERYSVPFTSLLHPENIITESLYATIRKHVV